MARRGSDWEAMSFWTLVGEPIEEEEEWKWCCSEEEEDDENTPFEAMVLRFFDNTVNDRCIVFSDN